MKENYYIFATKSRLVAMGYASKGKELNFEYHCTVARLEAVRPGHCKAIYGLKRKHSKRVGYDELQLLVSKRILQRSHNAISCSPDPAFPYKAPSMSDITYKRNRLEKEFRGIWWYNENSKIDMILITSVVRMILTALEWKPIVKEILLNLNDHRAQVDQESQIKVIQVKEMMQDNDLKSSKSKDKGSRSRSQSMNEQSHYKQDKTKTRQSINVKSHIFNVIGGTSGRRRTHFVNMLLLLMILFLISGKKKEGRGKKQIQSRLVVWRVRVLSYQMSPMSCTIMSLIKRAERTRKGSWHKGEKKRSFTPLLFSFPPLNQPSSSCVNDDDDGNGERTSRANTPSPIRFVNSLTNKVPQVFQNPPNIDPHLEPFYIRQTKIINCQVQIRDERRGGLRSIRKGLINLWKNMKK
ncbi:hypothetical protein Tco_1291785 [Tanacetum coccineum]